MGGPLSFLSELRKRFRETLALSEEQVIFPPDSKYFVAIGAAMLAPKYGMHTIAELLKKIAEVKPEALSETKHLPPLFEDEADYREFTERHEKDKMKRKPLEEAVGKLYLGIDAGSTTTKAALIDENKNLLYSFYKGNDGKPIEATLAMLKELYPQIPEDAYIQKATVTGYGENLIKAAVRADFGEIETMAHYKAQKNFYLASILF